MNPSAPDLPAPTISDGALAEAAVWIARLHGPDRTQAVESGWRDWFNAHPNHAAAWELVTDKWNKSHAIPVGLVHPPVRVRRRRFWRQPVLLAIAVALAAGGVLVGTLLLVKGFFGRGLVTTSIGEQKTINLQDGTRIELNTNTRLVVKYDTSKRVVELKSGEAYFSAAHEGRPFIVTAGDCKVIAMGTSFTVRRDQSIEATTVTLIEGRLAVAPVAAPDVLPQGQIPEVTVLTAGQRLRIRQDTANTVDAPSIEGVTGWMRGQLIFDHTPLTEAVEELNRYSATHLSVRSPTAVSVLVSGTFRVGDSVSFARAAAQTYNLQLIHRGDEIVLKPSEGVRPVYK